MEKTPSSKPDRIQQLSNAIKRVIFGMMMITGFVTIISMGPLAIIGLVLFLQIFCFTEVITIGYNYNKIPSNSLPNFRCLCWYFLIVANYFFSLETVFPHFQLFYKNYYYLDTLVTFNRFVSFCIYFIGIVIFVSSLVRKHALIIKQFQILAWTHTLLILIVTQSYLIIDNMFHGLIWLILPSTLVIINDIFAYIFGRLFGKTPLIKVSPKKTWEGFIGGAVGTAIAGYFISNLMCDYKYFTCPISYIQTPSGIQMNTNCAPNNLFEKTNFQVLNIASFSYYPFTVHFLAFTFFASIFAPFGGFCASGFKRAFKIKDFGDVIPGHGGIMDRFDCQFLMGTFVHVYISTFVSTPNVDDIFEKFLYLDEDSQVQFYNMLKDSLLKFNDIVINGLDNATLSSYIM